MSDLRRASDAGAPSVLFQTMRQYRSGPVAIGNLCGRRRRAAGRRGRRRGIGDRALRGGSAFRFLDPAAFAAGGGEENFVDKPVAHRLCRPTCRAQVAQSVEHCTENAGVGGSIPPLGTTIPPSARQASISRSPTIRNSEIPSSSWKCRKWRGCSVRAGASRIPARSAAVAEASTCPSTIATP